MKKDSIIEEIDNYTNQMRLAGIPVQNAKIVLRAEGGRFVIALPVPRFLEAEKLKEEHALAWEIFQKDAEANAYIRTYPKYCSLVAESGKEIPPVLDDMAQIVGVHAHICKEDNKERICRLLKKNHACLINSPDPDRRGAVAVGRSLSQAFAATLVLEKSAQVFIQTRVLGGARLLNPLEATVMNVGYRVKYSRQNDSIVRQGPGDFTREIPKEEFTLREQMVSLGRRLSQENLVQGTWGNLSVRLDDSYMLCTPSGMDYFTLTPYDIVRVNIDTLNYEGRVKPTSERTFHAGLIRKHEDVNCVIHTHPFAGSVFAAAHCPVEPQDEDSRRILQGKAVVASYGFPGFKKLSANVVNAIGNNRACIMENHGIVVCGSSMEDAYEKCKVLETCAREELKQRVQGKGNRL